MVWNDPDHHKRTEETKMTELTENVDLDTLLIISEIKFVDFGLSSSSGSDVMKYGTSMYSSAADMRAYLDRGTAKVLTRDLFLA
jgi:hypothetical protein